MIGDVSGLATALGIVLALLAWKWGRRRMAVAWRVNGALAANDTDTTLPIVAPSVGVVVDDIFIATILSKDSQVVTPPAGWTEAYQANTFVDQRTSIFWKRVEAGDAGATFNFTKPVDNNKLFCGFVSCFAGCRVTATPIDASAPSVAFTNSGGLTDLPINYADFDPTEDKAFVVALAVFNDNSSAPEDIPGSNPNFTQRFDQETSVAVGATMLMSTGHSNGAPTGARVQPFGSALVARSTGILFGLVSKPKQEEVEISGPVTPARAEGAVGSFGIMGAVGASEEGVVPDPIEAGGAIGETGSGAVPGPLSSSGKIGVASEGRLRSS